MGGLGNKQLGVCNKMEPKVNDNIYDEFATGIAKVRNLSFLSGRNILLDRGYYCLHSYNRKLFWYLACKKCFKKVCVEGGIKKCLKCGEETLNDICRYKLEGDSNKSIPKIIEENLIDKRVLFEVKLTTENNFKEIDHYLVNRLTFDDKIMEIHALKYNGSQENVTDDSDILSDDSRISPTIEDSVKMDKKDKGKAKIDDISNSEHSLEGDEMEHINEEDPIPTTNAAHQNSQVGEHTSKKGITVDPEATYKICLTLSCNRV
ncbi:hypothetical protein CASFOL_028517 [Castilleja foliolosa]|uniref:Replication factor A C-terminal domain-containing protein n=1 Tax=Castilleja foliolosa TaxID=1961234 RepID=A0ABD3CCT8_9LAMI